MVVELLGARVASSELRLVVEDVVVEEEGGEREEGVEDLEEVGEGLEDVEDDKLTHYCIMFSVLLFVFFDVN